MPRSTMQWTLNFYNILIHLHLDIVGGFILSVYQFFCRKSIVDAAVYEDLLSASASGEYGF